MGLLLDVKEQRLQNSELSSLAEPGPPSIQSDGEEARAQPQAVALRRPRGRSMHEHRIEI